MIVRRSLQVVSKATRFLRTQILCKYSTIYGLSSGLEPKGNAIAIIRISGQHTIDALNRLTRGNSSKWVSKPRTALLGSLYEPDSGDLIDKGIIIYFPSHSSYTGEDLCELHVHGSRSVVSSLLESIGKINDCRPSVAGEFTKRAFLNGKMDLTEIEGISDLIASQTTAQRKHALQAVIGLLSRRYDGWRNTLLEVAAYIEANIDFGEDELLEEEQLNSVVKKMTELRNEIDALVGDVSRKSERIRHGIDIAIIGEPNVGKSTLINKLCQREISIVSPISGTTRDIVESLLDIGGYAVRLCDTAGIKDTSQPLHDVVEQEGIRRAITRAQNVDLIIYVIDGSKRDPMNAIERDRLKYSQVMNKAASVVFVINKSDLIPLQYSEQLKGRISIGNQCVISCKTSEGFDGFIDLLTNEIKSLCGHNSDQESAFITERHKTHLNKLVNNLDNSVLYYKTDLSISAYYVREACKELSYITGRITTEDVLDVVFRQFCVGK